MRYKQIDNSLFKKNRKKLSKGLPGSGLALLHSNDEMPRNGDQFYRFRQNSDFFYLTGIEQEKSMLLLAPDCNEIQFREVLFILKSNKNLEIWEGHKLTKAEAKSLSGINTILFTEEFETVIKMVMNDAEEVFLNSNEYPKFYTDVESRDFRFGGNMRTEFPLHNYNRLAPIMWDLRCIKEHEEIELMQPKTILMMVIVFIVCFTTR